MLFGVQFHICQLTDNLAAAEAHARISFADYDAKHRKVEMSPTNTTWYMSYQSMVWYATSPQRRPLWLLLFPATFC